MDLAKKEERKDRMMRNWQKKPERGANESQSFPARLSVRVDYLIFWQFLNYIFSMLRSSQIIGSYGLLYVCNLWFCEMLKTFKFKSLVIHNWQHTEILT